MQEFHLGITQAIVSAILWGLVYSLDEKILSKISPILLMLIGCFVQMLILLPFTSKENYKEFSKISNYDVGLIIFTISMSTLAGILTLSGIKKVDAATISIIEIAYPVFVVLFSLIFYSKIPNIYFFLGGFLIFIGSFIIIKYA